jgi:hypothetical protein
MGGKQKRRATRDSFGEQDHGMEGGGGRREGVREGGREGGRGAEREGVREG